MLLVDIGNTNYHIYDNGKITHLKDIRAFGRKLYYISVNSKKEQKLVELNPKAVNLAGYVRFDTRYKGLGIDRIMACKTISDGVVVDAGSAITVDVMESSVHKGGVILPGVYAFKKAFGTISEVLNFNPSPLSPQLPDSTQEALNWGSIGAVVCVIEKVSQNKKVFFTGGDGKIFEEYFKNSEYIEDLVFRGMLKTIEEMEKK